MSKVKHILGISGGKDSAALALYLNRLYPDLDIEYYTCDTGRELNETYQLINRLESYMGKSIKQLDAVDLSNNSLESSFDYFLDLYGGYLPSSSTRWCTKKLKLEPFEKYITDEPTISYVGIRGDEDRDGYISKKQSVQSIFPFRKNIWSEDVNKLVLNASNLNWLVETATSIVDAKYSEAFLKVAATPLSQNFSLRQKLNALLDVSIKSYNYVVFHMLKKTDYPVGKLSEFPVLNNEENLILEDIFKLLEDSGVGIPAYYKPLEYSVEINGKIEKGTYSRSRSGCFFCFYQQKIEWVWLLENHPSLYEKAISYEKDGYSWMDNETLEELRHPDRVKAIKTDHFKRSEKAKNKKSWKDQILEADGEGCSSCFI